MAEQNKIRVKDLDRLSNLGDEILFQILSFLPTEDAVRTSILSPRWRHLFASMSKFYFQDQLLMKSGNPMDSNKVDNFVQYVYRLMSYPSDTRLRRFWITFIKEIVDASHVYNWICIALLRGVMSLQLALWYRANPNLELPTHLYTSKTLGALGLSMPYKYLKIPTNVCLPNLRYLVLRYTLFFDGDSVRRLISSCPALQYLDIKECYIRMPTTELHISHPSIKTLAFVRNRKRNNSLVINAPSLVDFYYTDAISKHGCAISNMPSLINAILSIRLEEFPLNDKCKHDANKLLQAIGNVKSLQLTIEQPKELLEYPKLVFLNLDKLEIIEGKNYNNYWQGTWLVEFLRRSPNLKSLLISLEHGRDGDWSPPSEVPECLSQLMEIKMLKFNGDSRLIHMITYFLMNAKLLEKLTISTDSLEVEERVRIYKELLKIPRRSGTCQVVIL